VSPSNVSNNQSAADRIAQLHQAMTDAKSSLLQAQQRQSHYANLKRRELVLTVGQSVFLSSEHLQLKDKDRTKKLMEKYIGPFQVKRVVSSVAYELELPSTMKIHPVFHVSKLKPMKSSSSSAYPDRASSVAPRPPPELINEDGDEEWEVERVVKERTVKRGRNGTKRIEYLVKWLGYPEWEMTWEPASNLTHAHDAIREFKSGRGRVDVDVVQGNQQ
jgi:glycosylphosphatidylinositol phospholipase D